MADAAILRRPAAAGLALFAHPRSVALSAVNGVARLSVRAGHETVAAIGRAFGVELPLAPLRSNARDGRAALWLGPDEWLLLLEEAEAEAAAAALQAAVGDRLWSCVDISHRNAGFLIAGPRVAEVLNAGCPLPLDPGAFPIGRCTRTLFGKAEIVLWRVGEAAFRIEVARSFAAYLASLVAEAAREHMALDPRRTGLG